MVVAVASGKGGVGKTTVAVSLALVAARQTKVHFLDCDVEEPNANIFLKRPIEKTEKVFTDKPLIDLDRCSLY